MPDKPVLHQMSWDLLEDFDEKALSPIQSHHAFQKDEQGYTGDRSCLLSLPASPFLGQRPLEVIVH